MSNTLIRLNCRFLHAFITGWEWEWCLDNRTFVSSFDWGLCFEFFLIWLCSSVCAYISGESARRDFVVGNSVRDEVAAIRCCLSVIVSEGKNGVEETRIDFVVKGISFEEIVGAANKDRHFWGIFQCLCEGKSNVDENQYFFHK